MSIVDVLAVVGLVVLVFLLIGSLFGYIEWRS